MSDLGTSNTDPAPVISQRADELSRELTLPRDLPTQEDLEAILAMLRPELVRRVAECERLIGFLDTGMELAARVAKLEAFLGIKV